MSPTELDLPVLISADQIRRREFVTKRRGYDPGQVRRYLEQLAEQVDLMASMIREARLEAEAAHRSGAEPRADPYERLAQRVANVIREADETAERLRVDGQRDAERVVSEARGEAERIRTDASSAAENARAEAEHALMEARAKADRTVSELSVRRRALVGHLAEMQERLLGVARELEAAIEAPSPLGDEVENAPEPRPMNGGWSSEPGAPTPESGRSPTQLGGSMAQAGGAAPQAAGPGPGSSTKTEDSKRIVDITDQPKPAAPLFELDPPTVDALLESKGLWEGTEAIQIDVPDIPPLDLSWGDEETREETQEETQEEEEEDASSTD